MAVSVKEIKEVGQQPATFEIAHPVYSKLRSPLILGHKSNAEVTRDIWLGFRHYELCLLDRYRPRRHFHLGHPVSLQSKVAHIS
jgi:hypothetical protein